MDDTGALTLLMNFIGPILLGVGLVAVLFYTWRRRLSRAAQAHTDVGTKSLYQRTEEQRRSTEGN